jgi:hypothetical protein
LLADRRGPVELARPADVWPALVESLLAEQLVAVEIGRWHLVSLCRFAGARAREK